MTIILLYDCDYNNVDARIFRIHESPCLRGNTTVAAWKLGAFFRDFSKKEKKNFSMAEGFYCACLIVHNKNFVIFFQNGAIYDDAWRASELQVHRD